MYCFKHFTYNPEWHHSKESMCCMKNIVPCNYWTDTQMDGQIDTGLNWSLCAATLCWKHNKRTKHYDKCKTIFILPYLGHSKHIPYYMLEIAVYGPACRTVYIPVLYVGNRSIWSSLSYCIDWCSDGGSLRTKNIPVLYVGNRSIWSSLSYCIDWCSDGGSLKSHAHTEPSTYSTRVGVQTIIYLSTDVLQCRSANSLYNSRENVIYSKSQKIYTVMIRLSGHVCSWSIFPD